MNRRNFLTRIASAMGVLAAAPALAGPVEAESLQADTWFPEPWMRRCEARARSELAAIEWFPLNQLWRAQRVRPVACFDKSA